MRIMTLNIPEKYLTFIQYLVESDKKHHPNRSWTIRDFLSSFLEKEKEFIKTFCPEEGTQKICTINMPEEFFEEMDNIVALGLYPSRSELVRCCIREKIIEKLISLNKLHVQDKNLDQAKERGEEELIRIPIDNKEKTLEVMEEKEDSFILKTRVMGSKEEFLRSKAVIKPQQSNSLLQFNDEQLEYEPIEDRMW